MPPGWCSTPRIPASRFVTEATCRSWTPCSNSITEQRASIIRRSIGTRSRLTAPRCTIRRRPVPTQATSKCTIHASPAGICSQGETAVLAGHDEQLPSTELAVQEPHALQAKDLKSLKRLVLSQRSRHEDDGVWETFESLIANHDLHLLMDPDAGVVRDEVLRSALEERQRVSKLVQVAEQMSSSNNFQWPELYVKTIHFYLAEGHHDDAIFWHLRLSPSFPPSAETFAALLSTFIVDNEPSMQSTLTSLYIFHRNRNMYDVVIPTLFESGNSSLARAWRKKQLSLKDFPSDQRARPFLSFLSRYYPTISLAKEELAVVGQQDSSASRLPSDDAGSVPNSDSDHASRGHIGDLFLAKLFASSWTSVDFAIHFAHGLGITTIGSRPLQSLAIREADADKVAKRISQMAKMGIGVSSQTYCKVIAALADKSQDGLLETLLHCDVHPDEFDDPETVRMLRASADEKGDSPMVELLDSVQLVSREETSVTQSLPARRERVRERRPEIPPHDIISRMEASKTDISQPTADDLLQRAFRGIWYHPNGQRGRPVVQPEKQRRHLNQAIDVVRRMSAFDVAIPSHYWTLLAYNLGRLGRFDELEQLSLEIVELYNPAYGGLIPVHPSDLPPSAQLARPARWRSEDSKNALARKMAEVAWRHMNPSDPMIPEMSRTLQNPSTFRSESLHESDEGQPERSYIPADLPYSHRQHPLQKIFGPRLQRSVIRWGFDQALRTPSTESSNVSSKVARSSHFDVARGVRLLALLRDQGVLIDRQIIRSALVSRMAIAAIPGRQRDRSRDSHELSPERVKRLVNGAWGSELLPGGEELLEALDREKPKLRSRYSKLFSKAYDKHVPETNGD